MNAYILSLSLTALASFSLGLFVLSKNIRNQINIIFFLFCFSVCLWSFLTVFLLTAPTAEQGLFYSKTSNVAAAFISSFFLHFCYVVANAQKKDRPLLNVSYASSILITFFSLSDNFTYVEKVAFFNFYTRAKPFYYFFTFHFLFFSILGQLALIRGIKISDKEKANQLIYILVATSLGYLSGFTYFLPVYGFPPVPFFPHFVWLYTAIISYAIVKHGLMDITVVIRAGIAYSILIGLITTIYFVAVYLTGHFFQTFIGYKSWPIVLIAFTLIALIFKPLERKIQLFVDIYLFRRSPELLERENLKLREAVQKQDQMKAVATLAAGMAHEIKNPLTSIKTFAEYLPEKYDSPEFREKFKRIVTSEVDRVNNIVKQLLEFSKPQEALLKPASLSQALEETLSLLNNDFLKNKIEVNKEYGKSMQILVDRNLLKQAFLNILLNSIQAMPNGGTLRISSAITSSSVCISFADSGIGIPKDKLPHIFDPFFTTKEEGTGLGLAIVHSIIEKHGGKIEVASVPGKGTTFNVFLKNRSSYTPSS